MNYNLPPKVETIQTPQIEYIAQSEQTTPEQNNTEESQKTKEIPLTVCRFRNIQELKASMNSTPTQNRRHNITFGCDKEPAGKNQNPDKAELTINESVVSKQILIEYISRPNVKTVTFEDKYTKISDEQDRNSNINKIIFVKEDDGQITIKKRVGL